MTPDLALTSSSLHLYGPRVHSASPLAALTELRASANANGAWTPANTRRSAAAAVVAAADLKGAAAAINADH